MYAIGKTNSIVEVYTMDRAVSLLGSRHLGARAVEAICFSHRADRIFVYVPFLCFTVRCHLTLFAANVPMDKPLSARYRRLRSECQCRSSPSSQPVHTR